MERGIEVINRSLIDSQGWATHAGVSLFVQRSDDSVDLVPNMFL